jgi:hypothetical protein
MKDAKVNLNLSPDAIKKSILAFLHRFHIVLFVIVVLGGLAVVIFLLNNVVVTSGQDNGYTPDINNTSFDQSTIQKIQNLKTADQSDPTISNNGARINPFVE